MSKQQQPAAQNEPCCTPLVREPLTEDWAGDLARMFKALGDPVRLRLLSRVASHAGGEACVCDLSAGLDLSQPTISHHLKVLREAGLLECERRGTWVYYWVVPSALAQLSAVLGSTDVSTSGLGSPDANPSQPGVPVPALLA
jgi:ArsR family transcriptional regulator